MPSLGIENWTFNLLLIQTQILTITVTYRPEKKKLPDTLNHCKAASYYYFHYVNNNANCQLSQSINVFYGLQNVRWCQVANSKSLWVQGDVFISRILLDLKKRKILTGEEWWENSPEKWIRRLINYQNSCQLISCQSSKPRWMFQLWILVLLPKLNFKA